jgi:hypothetical protein
VKPSSIDREKLRAHTHEKTRATKHESAKANAKAHVGVAKNELGRDGRFHSARLSNNEQNSDVTVGMCDVHDGAAGGGR